jgi:hypothetical protein
MKRNEIIIHDFSLQSAFSRLTEELETEGFDKENWPTYLEKFINLDEYEGFNVETAEDFQGKGLIFGYTVEHPSENSNKIKSRVENVVIEGDKKWETRYLALYDEPYGHEVVEDSNKPIKKECIDIARAATELTGRTTYVIIGKSPIEFDRCQAEITYIPSQKQKMGKYMFIW